MYVRVDHPTARNSHPTGNHHITGPRASRQKTHGQGHHRDFASDGRHLDRKHKTKRRTGVVHTTTDATTTCHRQDQPPSSEPTNRPGTHPVSHAERTIPSSHVPRRTGSGGTAPRPFPTPCVPWPVPIPAVERVARPCRARRHRSPVRVERGNTRPRGRQTGCVRQPHTQGTRGG